MQTNQSLITSAYHYVSEAIIIFLIALPILHYQFQFVPYGSYIVVVLISIILLLLINKWLKGYGWAWLMAPVLLSAFYLLDYPLIFAGAFSILLVYRYINIMKEVRIRRENKYIVATLLITAVASILVHDMKVMIYPFLQFITLFLGYIFSQFIVVDTKERKQVSLKLPIFLVVFFVVGGAILFALFDLLRSMALSISYGFINVIGAGIKGTSDFLSFVTVERRGWPDQAPPGAEHGEGYFKAVEEFNIVEAMTGLVIIAVGAVLLLALVLIVISVFRKRRKRTEDRYENKGDAVAYGEFFNGKSNNQIHNPFKRYFQRPNHPIRKAVYQFEKSAAKLNKGRKAYETIEEWLQRINGTIDFEAYQKVRYGNKEITNDEVHLLKKQLKEMEEILEQAK